MANPKSTVRVWVPMDEYAARLRQKLEDYGLGSVAYIEDVERDLAQMGLRFNADQLARLKAATQAYRALWDELVPSLPIERFGAPTGPVPPENADEHFRRTGKCLVTIDEEQQTGAESRSRH